MKRTLKKQIAGLCFGALALSMPTATAITASSTKAVTIAAIYSDSKDAQAAAVVVDTGVAVAMTLGWLCGIQGAIATIYAG